MGQLRPGSGLAGHHKGGLALPKPVTSLFYGTAGESIATKRVHPRRDTASSHVAIWRYEPDA